MFLDSDTLFVKSDIISASVVGAIGLITLIAVLFVFCSPIRPMALLDGVSSRVSPTTHWALAFLSFVVTILVVIALIVDTYARGTTEGDDEDWIGFGAFKKHFHFQNGNVFNFCDGYTCVNSKQKTCQQNTCSDHCTIRTVPHTSCFPSLHS